ncbi:hypothetical protein [Myxacorys almedinensis]|uniref:Uncharacterized protein n=1 Tax=Myxacorys almedinensis A TaxID=2690445 RepID=A0A8J8CN77_9CYAN|nr:hypothetical protein [Myxacorys almedinensis]NDJ18122.1 hypothetical protein [Myxacorys almedinensis A]
MKRLNQEAFDILQSEVQVYGERDLVWKVQREMVLRRLKKLTLQEGIPLSYADIQEAIVDLLPDFKDKALRSAAIANRPPSPRGTGMKFGIPFKARLALMAFGTAMGGVFIANLPFAWIRLPVAQAAPVLLTPSYMSMDYHYRRAIALVEQADQLVNQSTAFEDLEVGSSKAKEAQQHLDALPVWFLGSYPTAYCQWSNCYWRFTYDEFQTARQEVARMEAKLFQEHNAHAKLVKADQVLADSMQAMQAAKGSAKRKASAEWQGALDRLEHIPSQTLAGRIAEKKLVAAKRDFEQITGSEAAHTLSANLIGAAKQFATAAQHPDQKPPHDAYQLRAIEGLWNDAIARLDKISERDADYPEAQKLLVTYKKALANAKIQLQTEADSAHAYAQAQQLTQQLMTSMENPFTTDRAQISSRLQKIIQELEKVKQGTTTYAEAQLLMESAQKRLH